MPMRPVPYEVIRRDDGQAALSLNLAELPCSPTGWAMLECASPDAGATAEEEPAAGSTFDVALQAPDGFAVVLRQVPSDVCSQAISNGALRLYAWDGVAGAVAGKNWRLPLVAGDQSSLVPPRPRP